MKKIMKKEVIISFIIGVILASSIAVYASINASEVDYKNNQKVSDALDDLYNKVSTYKNLSTTTTVSPNSLLNGYTAYDNSGNLITGSISTNCITKTITSSEMITSNNTELIDFGFEPSYFVVYILNTSNWVYDIYQYDKKQWDEGFVLMGDKRNTTWHKFSDVTSWFLFENNKLYIPNISQWDQNNTFRITACR